MQSTFFPTKFMAAVMFEIYLCTHECRLRIGSPRVTTKKIVRIFVLSQLNYFGRESCLLWVFSAVSKSISRSLFLSTSFVVLTRELFPLTTVFFCIQQSNG